jgi:iron(III) transport system substrate-binding protein
LNRSSLDWENFWRRRLLLLALMLSLPAIWLTSLQWLSSSQPLIVYCAHDQELAQPVLDRFTRETGIPVQVRFDTEATKSLGLQQLILSEQAHPRCDVFWNNEQLGMQHLASQGLLASYQGSGWHARNDQYRDVDGYWVGFAARLRVLIWRKSLDSQLPNFDPHFAWDAPANPMGLRKGIAIPLYGTTLTHFTCLWNLNKQAGLEAFVTRFRSEGGRFVPGNAAVKNLVANETLDIGWTDTDDAFAAQDEKAAIKFAPALFNGKLICIPNTVAIIKNCKNQAAAKTLVDFLTSRSAELQLANSAGRQIPLQQVSPDELSGDVRPLYEAVTSRPVISLKELLAEREACRVWLGTLGF